MTLADEKFGKAAEVGPGFWIIATRHRPGLSQKMFEINNRCLVFKLPEAGRQVLVVANAVDPTQAISEVRRLERETGAPVRYILSVGGGHHLHAGAWADEIKDAKILLPPVRVPRTRNGRKLIERPNVALMNLENPLPQFKGQLNAVVFHGLFGFQDHLSVAEGGKDGPLGMLKFMFEMMRGLKDPTDELWLHHAATGTVIGGENLGWYYTAAEYKKLPFMGRQMVKPDTVMIMSKPRPVADASVVSACWKQILAWPMTALMTYHDPPGCAATTEPRATLEKAVRAARQLA